MTLHDSALAHLREVLAAEQDEPAPPPAVDRYELLERVGRGGMGEVWRARDRQLEREVAFKVLATTEDGSGGAQLAARLLQEAKVLARLEHPGIVPVHDAGVLADGRAWCAMKLVRGRRLDELVAAGLAEPERHRIFARIGEAVAFAHSRGVLHRDLKPGNVMVGEFGEVLVLDWGLAKLAAPRAGDAASNAKGEGSKARAQSPEDAASSGAAPRAAAFGDPAAPIEPDVDVRPRALTRHGTRLGTPGFMAPEQERGEVDVDARADVYGLGVLLRFLWSDGRGAARPLPRPLAAIVAKATASAPAARYASVLELAADVARFQAEEPVTALPEGIGLKLARFYRRYRAGIWLIGTYLLLRVAFELWHWSRRNA